MENEWLKGISESAAVPAAASRNLRLDRVEFFIFFDKSDFMKILLIIAVAEFAIKKR
jgi:hypothetical protein